MYNVLRLAKWMYPEEEYEKFRAWLGLLIDEAGVKDKDFYSTGDVFPMLKVSQRIYQLWERRPDFPIKEPHRIKGNRAYSPQDVVAIAFWKWRRKDKRMREGGD